MSWLGLWLAGLASAGSVDSASHVGTREGDSIRWESRYAVSEAGVVDLEPPLTDVEVVDAAGLEPRWQDGVLIGLDVHANLALLTLRQPLPDGRGERLAAPLVGETPQRIELEGLRFEPAPALGLQPHIGHHRSPGLSAKDRRALDRRWDGLLGVELGDALYLGGDGPVVTRGLVGTVMPRTEVPWVVTGVSLAAFLLAVLGLLGASRLTDRAVRRARNEAYLRDELGMP